MKEGRSTPRSPSPATGTPPRRVGDDPGETDVQPEQNPVTRDAGARRADSRAPQPGSTEQRDLREHDMATHPDQVPDSPDGAGNRPRPI